MIIAFPATEREVVIPAVRPAAVIAETTSNKSRLNRADFSLIDSKKTAAHTTMIPATKITAELLILFSDT